MVYYFRASPRDQTTVLTLYLKWNKLITFKEFWYISFESRWLKGKEAQGSPIKNLEKRLYKLDLLAFDSLRSQRERGTFTGNPSKGMRKLYRRKGQTGLMTTNRVREWVRAYWLREPAAVQVWEPEFESQHRQHWLWPPHAPVTVLLGGIKTGSLLGLTGCQLNSIFSWIPISGVFPSGSCICAHKHMCPNICGWRTHTYTTDTYKSNWAPQLCLLQTANLDPWGSLIGF